MAEIKINITRIKIMKLIQDLNKLNLYPNAHGLLKIFNGVSDNETKKIIDIPGFGSLLSIHNRQLSSHVHQLVRYHFLTYICNPGDEQMYLTLTGKGESYLEYYLKKHKFVIKDKTIKKTPITIAYIKR